MFSTSLRILITYYIINSQLAKKKETVVISVLTFIFFLRDNLSFWNDFLLLFLTFSIMRLYDLK
jgi:hypothetical protein